MSKKTKQIITREYGFDAGHRVMNQAFKCSSLHGHRYRTLLKFAFSETSDLDYAIDFSEIKRVGAGWIDDHMDHGMLLNPKDEAIIAATEATKSKMWLMSLNGPGEYTNPSVEMISVEIFLAMEILFAEYVGLDVHEIEIFETVNCSTQCTAESVSDEQRANFYEQNLESIKAYAIDKGIVEYDDRKNQ